MIVRISFDYNPDEPDEQDPTGMSNEEYERMTDSLIALGADAIEIEKKEPDGHL